MNTENPYVSGGNRVMDGSMNTENPYVSGKVDNGMQM